MYICTIIRKSSLSYIFQYFYLQISLIICTFAQQTVRNMTRKLLTLTFFICSLQTIAIDDTTLPMGELISFRPTADNAMSMYHARCVTQDSTGFIWIGSGSGLYRYDGYHYQQMRTTGNPNLLPDESVQSLANWGDRYIWIRLRGNFYSCFDVQKDKFVHWNGNQSANEPYRRCTIIDSRHLWLYDDEKGCCHLESHDDGTISAMVYNVHNKQLPSNHIRFILHDKNGVAFVGTDKGLVKIQQDKSKLLIQDQNFTCAQQVGSDLFFITLHGTIYRLTTSGVKQEFVPTDFNHKVENVAYEQNTLIITTDNPTLRYDIQKRQLTEHPFIHINKARIVVDNHGNKVLFDADGTDIWYLTPAVTYHLPSIYSPEMTHQNSNGNFRFICGSQGRLWASTYGNGLHAYNTHTGDMSHFHRNDGLHTLLTSDYLLDIFEDKEGNLWVCQENQGIRIIDKSEHPAQQLFFTTADDYGHANIIRLIRQIGNQILVGNRLNDMWMTDTKLQNIKNENPYHDDVVAANTDNKGRLWVGTRNKGIFVDQQQLGPIMSGKVSDILCDRQGRTWISMFDGGLELVTTADDGTMTVQSFFKGSHAITQPRDMLQDQQGRIWLSSSRGLYIFHPDKLLKNPADYQYINVNGRNVNSDEVHCLFEDSQHHIWAGTTGYGLVELNLQGEIIQRYTSSDGLPNNRIESIVEDHDSCLWVGTNYGLAKISKDRQLINSFFLTNSEQGLMYTEGCAMLLDDGRLAFGTQHGMQIFYPDAIKPIHNSFPLAITNLYVNGSNLLDMENLSLSSSSLSFDHEQNSLTFYFSDFSFTGSNRAKFSYFLEGYDRDWSEQSTLNMATYKNLPSGSYTLHVRSYNANGMLNEHEATLNFVIRQPWWNTWWAWLINILFLGSIVWTIWRQWRRNEELHNKMTVENKLTEFKLRFYTNISHEFRTPLTIIRNAMDNISTQGELPGKLKQPISSMKKSTDRLLRLINELLEFRKIQNEKLQLQLEETDIVAFLRNIFLTFNESAGNRQINYQFSTFAREYLIYIDRNYVDKMAYNLLSNAFKYTPPKHEITMKVGLQNGLLSFSVEDTGIGVSREKQGDLFTRFNQSSFSRESIGIGLHMVSELVRVHHGEISFQENPQGGSIFTIVLPTDKSVYQPSDFLVQEGNALLTGYTDTQGPTASTYKEMSAPPLNDRTVLLVDDDDDLRNQLAADLRHYYNIETATDGGEALRMIQEKRPELVISDVRMPGMGGFELTKKIRQTPEISDLPIILLTAISDEEKKVKGTEYGADEYLIKPFSMKLLVAKCRSLIAQRDRLRVRYAKEVVGSAPLADIIVEDADKKFLERFENWVSAHLSQTDMQAMDFANSMKMGRTTFFKKVKQVTGMPPHEYIRKIRMQRAAELLQDPAQSIAEVSYQTGFEDPSYFSRTFKEYFGITASQFRKGGNGKPSITKS